MYTLIIILIIVVCFLLVGVVMVQNSKGGGLASDFSSSNQIIGVQRTGDFLEKATWTLAIVLLGLSLVAAAVQAPDTAVGNAQESEIKDFIDGEPVLPPSGFQNNPAPKPAN